MKLYTLATTVSYLCAVCYGYLPDLKNQQPIESNHEPGHLSMPNLLDVDSINDLALTWKPLSNVKLDNGRLVYDNTGGSIWSLAGLANTPNEWTIEVVFRSSGVTEDLQYANDNGLAVWLIDASNSLPIDEHNMENFGGPTKYDGFQLLVNNKESRGLKIFSSDGSSDSTSNLADSLGSCQFNYLNSQIPFTLRLSYSKSRNWFKIQLDNELCFKTEAISIPDSTNDFRFGVSASLNPNSKEYFEVFKYSVWSHLTEDAIDDHGLMSNGQIKLSTESKQTDSRDQGGVHPSVVRQSLMERSRLAREELARMEREQASANDNSLVTVSLDSLETKISEMNNAITKNSLDFESILIDLKGGQSRVENELRQSFNGFKEEIVKQYSEILTSIASINERLIGEVREQQFTIEEMSKKVDLLMSNHKEVSYQYNNLNNNDSRDLSDFFQLVVRWILIPFTLVVLFFAVVLYRLRHDIKHSKLL